MTTETSEGRWNAAYANTSKGKPQAYGDTVTYSKAADFLDGLNVEDWGCGLGWMRRLIPADRYTGVDGSHTPFADKIVKLSEYRSKTDGLFMRHVIEHNLNWKTILRNALDSFQDRMVLVLFTPLGDETRVLLNYEITPGVFIPELTLSRAELMQEIGPYLVREETVQTATTYNVEHIFYLEKKKPVTLVSAFFRLRDRAVDEDALFGHFDQLAACGLPIILFLDEKLADRAPSHPNVQIILRDLESLWPFKQDDDRPLPENRTPDKDTRDFILLQNAKLDLLASARGLDDSKYFAWIDFGIMKIVRDADGFREHLRNLKPPASCVLAPGCWSKNTPCSGVDWRFCGGFLLVDRNSIASLVAKHHQVFKQMPELTWEVNVWAEMERQGQRFDWYKADHDDSIIEINADARICLTMIVKNEARIIERCLTAAFPYIDTWSIVDTGSTDDTPQIIEQFFAAHQVPGKLSRSTFEDFEQARNGALDAAQKVEGWDYALLLDADMVLAGTIDKSKLDAPAYELIQKSGTLDYANTRLVRRNAGARYFGVTHEYLSVPRVEPLPTLVIDDRNDGGSKGDKGPRDIRLLTAGLVKEPNNGRYMFYLANTYREAGQHAEAIEWYRKRIQAGGWDEEIWSSYYSIARSYLSLEDEPNFIKACFDAYNFRPTRGEPLKLLAKFFREHSKNDAAMLIAESLSKIEYPKDKLFVEPKVYDFGAEQEFAIAGFYSRISDRRDLAYRTCADLTVHFDDHVRNEARRNITYYVKSAREMFGADVRPIAWTPDDGYAPMNPSVCIDEAGRRLILVRTVNYKVTTQGQYPTVDSSNIIRTRNHIVEMDADWKPVKSTRIEDITGLPRNTYPVEGFEDCRLCSDGFGNFYASATVRDLGDGRCEMAFLVLDEKWRITNVDVIRDYHHDQAQKNWMPIVGRCGSFLYFCDPTIVVERSSGATLERSRNLPDVYLGDQRGSSQLIAHGDGWLCITHEVSFRPERVYMHRFVKLDREMRAVGVTYPFYFAKVGIEFCAGLARDGDKLVASFGVNDESAHIALFDPARVDGLMKAFQG